MLASARSVRRPRRRRLLLPRNRRIVRGSLFLVQRVAHMEVRVDSVRAPVTVMGHGTKSSARVRNELQDHHLPPPGLGLLNALLTPVSCSRYLPLSCWSMYRAESCELASTYHYIVCYIYMYQCLLLHFSRCSSFVGGGSRTTSKPSISEPRTCSIFPS